MRNKEKICKVIDLNIWLNDYIFGFRMQNVTEIYVYLLSILLFLF